MRAQWTDQVACRGPCVQPGKQQEATQALPLLAVLREQLGRVHCENPATATNTHGLTSFHWERIYPTWDESSAENFL